MGFSRVLAAMDQRRAELGVKQGVAFLQVQDIASEVEYIAYRRQGRVEGKLPVWLSYVPFAPRGINYFGVAMAKLAWMLATGANSGEGRRKKIIGEVFWRGALTRTVDGFVINAGFSGGTKDEDLAIARAGLDLAEKIPRAEFKLP